MSVKKRLQTPDEIYAAVLKRKWSFFAVFTGVFFVLLVALGSMGLAPHALTFGLYQPHLIIPAPATPNGTDDVPATLALPTGSGDLPIRIEVPSIGVAATIANPKSTDVATLDRALLAGAVRYPGSALLGEEGNVLIFGHSSHLPIVHNKAYKAFNDIQNLKEGEPIFVYAEERRFVYVVETVEKANTETGGISLEAKGAKLTLATCDNFGEKSDRFIVTAKLVSIETPESQETPE